MLNVTRSALMILLVPSLAAANDDQIRSAGCFIANEQGVVLVVGRVNDGLQLPAGARKDGEPVACTAQRETLEETGLVVDVAERLMTGTKFVVYRCIPRVPVTATTVFQPVDWLEVKAVHLIDPQTQLTAAGVEVDLEWRYWRDRSTVRSLWRRKVYDQPATAIEPDCLKADEQASGSSP